MAGPFSSQATGTNATIMASNVSKPTQAQYDAQVKAFDAAHGTTIVGGGTVVPGGSPIRTPTPSVQVETPNKPIGNNPNIQNSYAAQLGIPIPAAGQTAYWTANKVSTPDGGSIINTQYQIVQQATQVHPFVAAQGGNNIALGNGQYIVGAPDMRAASGPIKTYGDNFAYNPATGLFESFTVIPPNVMQILPQTAPIMSYASIHWENGKPINEPAGYAFSRMLDDILPKAPDIGYTTPAGFGMSIYGGVRDVAVGTPKAIGDTLVTGELLIRSAISPQRTALPGVLGYSVVKYGSDLKDALFKNPVRTGTSVVAPMIVGGIVARGSGYIRTIGAERLPIEEYGYAPKLGYPKNPTPSSARNVLASFEDNTLYPKPKEMSLGGDVPYVPESARLPTTVLTGTQRVMWTGWENPPPVTGVGETYVLPVVKTSETSGMYGASVAQTYYAKVGTPMSDVIGANPFNLFKQPTMVVTKVDAIEAVPKGLRNLEGSKLFIETKSQPGVAYADLYKAEYQSILGSGQELRITGARNYYFKLGFENSKTGKPGVLNALFGQRVPVIEQETTGKIIRAGEAPGVAVPRGYSTTPLKATPLFDVSTAPVSSRAAASTPKLSYTAPKMSLSQYTSTRPRINYSISTPARSSSSVSSGSSAQSSRLSYGGSSTRPASSPRLSYGNSYGGSYGSSYGRSGGSSGGRSGGSSGGSGGSSGGRSGGSRSGFSSVYYPPSPPKPPYYPPLKFDNKMPKQDKTSGKSKWSGKNWINKVIGFKQAFGTGTPKKLFPKMRLV